MNATSLFLVSISVFLTILIDVYRKNLLKDFHFYTLIVFDALITGLFMIIAAFYLRGFDKFLKEIKKLTTHHVFILILISFLITSTAILGLKLLKDYNLGDLVIATTVVEIFVAMMFDYVYYGKPFTLNKIIAVPILISGLYIFRMNQ